MAKKTKFSLTEENKNTFIFHPEKLIISIELLDKVEHNITHKVNFIKNGWKVDICLCNNGRFFINENTLKN